MHGYIAGTTGGLRTKACGWKRWFSLSLKSKRWSTFNKVLLRVSEKRYEHTKMFGTELIMKNGVYQVKFTFLQNTQNTYKKAKDNICTGGAPSLSQM